MKELFNNYIDNQNSTMDEVSNDGLNSDIEEHEDDEDEEEFHSVSFNNINRIKNTTDEEILFNDNVLTNQEINFNANKRKRINSNKYCKKRKCRTTFTKSQLVTLENEFLKSNFVSNDRIDLLIESTGLDSRIIKNWFKNKRSRVLADSKTNNGCNKPSSDTQSLSSSSPFNIKTEKVINEINLLTPSIDSNSSISSNASTINHNQLFIQTSNLTNSLKENQNDIKTNLKVSYLPTKSNVNNPESSVPDLDSYHNPMYFNSISSNPVNVNTETDLKNTISNGLLNILTNGNHEYENKSMKMPNSPPITPAIVRSQQVKEDLVKKQNMNNLLELKDSNCNVCSRFSKLFCICNVSKIALNKLYKNYAGFNTILFHQEKRFCNQRLINNENESKIFELL